jgi:hypothetical protein
MQLGARDFGLALRGRHGLNGARGSGLASPGSREQANGGVRSLLAPATCPTGLASKCEIASLGPTMTPSRITESEPGVGANC